MARGTIVLVLTLKVDTGDRTPLEQVADLIAYSTLASHETETDTTMLKFHALAGVQSVEVLETEVHSKS